MKTLNAIKLPNVPDHVYESDDGYVMRREGEGKWVLRDQDAQKVDADRFRTDLAERNGFRIKHGDEV